MVLDYEGRFPTTSWSKKRLQDSIVRWGGSDEGWPLNWKEKKTRAQLLAETRRFAYHLNTRSKESLTNLRLKDFLSIFCSYL